jgi:hypothetical protein
VILVRIELHSARTGRVEEIGRMIIANISGKGVGRFHKRADYKVMLLRRGLVDKVQREGVVRDYPRLSYSVWRLVFRALKSVLHEERL